MLRASIKKIPFVNLFDVLTGVDDRELRPSRCLIRGANDGECDERVL